MRCILKRSTTAKTLIPIQKRNILLMVVTFLFLSFLGQTVSGQNNPPTLLMTLTGHTNVVGFVRFSPDGAELASSGCDGIIKLWDAQAGNSIYSVQGTTSGHVNGIAFSPDGTKLVSTGEDSKVRVWDVSAGTLIHTLSGHSGYTLDVSYSPDGTRFASSGWDNSVRIWDAATGNLVKVLSFSTSWATPVRYSPIDGNILAANSASNVIAI